jgi:lysozyme family protein
VRHYTPLTTFTMNYTTTLSFISFSSTQDNALNQDLFGTSGNMTANLTWGDLGAITAPLDAYGRVPEPATYAQIAALLAAGVFVVWRRRQAAKKESTPGDNSARA